MKDLYWHLTRKCLVLYGIILPHHFLEGSESSLRVVWVNDPKCGVLLIAFTTHSDYDQSVRHPDSIGVIGHHEQRALTLLQQLQQAGYRIGFQRLDSHPRFGSQEIELAITYT